MSTTTVLTVSSAKALAVALTNAFPSANKPDQRSFSEVEQVATIESIPEGSRGTTEWLDVRVRMTLLVTVEPGAMQELLRDYQFRVKTTEGEKRTVSRLYHSYFGEKEVLEAQFTVRIESKEYQFSIEERGPGRH